MKRQQDVSLLRRANFMEEKKKTNGNEEKEVITADEIISILLLIASFAKCLARQLIVEQESFRKEELKRGFKL